MRTGTFDIGSLAVHARTNTRTQHLIFPRAWLWTGFLTFVTIVFGPRPAQAAVMEAFVQRYSGPANGYDQATAVAVDGSGNLVVTRYSPSRFDNSISDYYTAKYAVADGALLWEKRIAGPASGVYRSSRGLARAPDGMVAVTGNLNGDYATVGYREVPEAVSINLAATGVRVRFFGISGHSYNIERAPALTFPWPTILTQTAPTSGLFEYLDILSHLSSGFYRIVQP